MSSQRLRHTKTQKVGKDNFEFLLHSMERESDNQSKAFLRKSKELAKSIHLNTNNLNLNPHPRANIKEAKQGQPIFFANVKNLSDSDVSSLNEEMVAEKTDKFRKKGRGVKEPK